MDAMTKYLRPPQRMGGAVWLFAVLTLGVACWLCLEVGTTYGSADEAEARALRIAGAQALRPEPKKSRKVMEEQRRWAALKLERDFDWGPVFAAVEEAGSPDIELLAFEPDKGNRSIKLSGEARNHKAMMEFIDALAGQVLMKHVHLTKQQRKKRDRLETTVFELRATIGG